MIRAMVVDDHPVFRKGLVALLRASGVEVVAEAVNGLEAVEVVRDLVPDVVLMDVAMPELSGLEATARITGEHPGVALVVVTLFDDEATVGRALRAGASAYVTKQAAPEQILAAVHAAAGGALLLGPGVPRPVAPSAPPPLPGLTPRERAVADLLGRGLANPVIAERLHLTPKTVANYVSAVLLKLGADDRTDAARRIRAARDGAG